jgi:hypothetical protein
MNEKNLKTLKKFVVALISGTCGTAVVAVFVLVIAMVYSFFTGNSITLPMNCLEITGGDVGEGITGAQITIKNNFYIILGIIMAIVTILIFTISVVKDKKRKVVNWPAS